jgi:hypothetical protein
MKYSSLFTTKTAPIAQWHKIMAHTNHEAIKQLAIAAEGVDISDIDSEKVDWPDRTGKTGPDWTGPFFWSLVRLFEFPVRSSPKMLDRGPPQNGPVRS